MMLVASLAITPINIVTGWRQIIPARKPLGLYAFLYAALHLLNFVGMDYGFSLQAFLDDALLQKRYMIVGFSAFFILLPLAITSTKGWMKRLGRNWKRLAPVGLRSGDLGGPSFPLASEGRHPRTPHLRYNSCSPARSANSTNSEICHGGAPPEIIQTYTIAK